MAVKIIGQVLDLSSYLFSFFFHAYFALFAAS